MNATHSTPSAAELAQVLAAAQGCFTGHNLLSTASEAELRETARRFLDWWNHSAAPTLAAFEQTEKSVPQ